ncbi:hypothetical protein D3C80_476840 [compost metagenome]
MVDDGHRDDAVAIGQIDTANTDRVTAGEHAHLIDREADCLAKCRRQKHVITRNGQIMVRRRAGLYGEDFVTLFLELHGDLAVAVDLNEIGQLVTANRTARCREHDVEVFPGILILGQRHDGGDAFAGFQRQHVDQRLAARLRRADRQAVDLFLVDDATRREEQNRRMGVDHEQARDEILVTRRHAGAALAATTLGAIGRKRHALDIAKMRYRDDHVFAGDEVFIVHVEAGIHDLGAARRAEFVTDGCELILDDGLDADARRQDVEIIGNLGTDLVQLVGDFIAAECGQAGKTQFEDGTRLLFGKIVGRVLVDPVARIVDQADQRFHVMCRPAASHQLLTGRCRIGCATDQLDDFVDIGDGDGETDQDVGAFARLAQQVFRAAADDFLTEGHEGAQHVEQRQLFRLAAVQRHHVAAERGLQRRVAVKLVEDDVSVCVTLQLDDDAVALAVRFVTKVGNALDALVLDQLSHLFDHRCLVHLIGNFGDDDLLAVAAHRLDRGKAAHHDRAAARLISRANTVLAENHCAGRKIRTGDDFHHLGQLDRRIINQRDTAVDDFRKIVRRDIGGHADSDAACAIDQQVGELGRHHDRLRHGAVVVVAKIDSFLVEVVEQRMRHLFQTALGVALGRRRIAVDRAEIALTVDQRHAQGPVLRHTGQSVIDRRVAVRMVFTHHVTGDAGALDVFLVPVEPQLVHPVENAAMDRLQAVTNIRKGAADDDAHGVIEIGALHLLHDGNGFDAWGQLSAAGCALLSQIGSRSLYGISCIFITERGNERQFPRGF